MATELDASEVLTRAAAKVRVDVRATVGAPASAVLREIPVAPITEWLAEAARMYELYEGRGWNTETVDRQVRGADCAALAFAHSVLGTQ